MYQPFISFSFLILYQNTSIFVNAANNEQSNLENSFPRYWCKSNMYWKTSIIMMVFMVNIPPI